MFRGARVVGCFIDATPREAIGRNARREGRARVPKAAIFACARRLEPPRLDEGFDELTTLRVRPAGDTA